MSSNYFQLIRLESFKTRFCNEATEGLKLLSFEFPTAEKNRKGRKNLKAFPFRSVSR